MSDSEIGCLGLCRIHGVSGSASYPLLPGPTIQQHVLLKLGPCNEGCSQMSSLFGRRLCLMMILPLEMKMMESSAHLWGEGNT